MLLRHILDQTPLLFQFLSAHYSPLVSSGDSHIGSGYGTSPDYDFPFPIHDLLPGL